MGVRTYYRRITGEQLAEVLCSEKSHRRRRLEAILDSVARRERAERQLCIGKALPILWQVFEEEKSADGTALIQAFFGEGQIGGRESPDYLTSEAARRLASGLRRFDPDRVKSRLSQIWGKDGSDRFDPSGAIREDLDHYRNLVGFFESAAGDGDAIIIESF